MTAATFYTTYLSQRETLYDVRYSSPQHLLETQYVVLREPPSGDYIQYDQGGENDGFENLVRFLEANGYTRYRSVENVLVIYQKK